MTNLIAAVINFVKIWKFLNSSVELVNNVIFIYNWNDLMNPLDIKVNVDK